MFQNLLHIAKSAQLNNKSKVVPLNNGYYDNVDERRLQQHERTTTPIETCKVQPLLRSMRKENSFLGVEFDGRKNHGDDDEVKLPNTSIAIVSFVFDVIVQT